MKRQLQGIALILVSILLMLGYGDVAFFDLSFKWDLIFSVIGITGVTRALNAHKALCAAPISMGRG